MAMVRTNYDLVEKVTVGHDEYNCDESDSWLG